MAPRRRPAPCPRCRCSLTEYNDDGDVSCICGHVSYTTPPLPYVHDAGNPNVTPVQSARIQWLAGIGLTYLEIAARLGIGRSTVGKHLARSHA